jgi:hypothetical protein
LSLFLMANACYPFVTDLSLRRHLLQASRHLLISIDNPWQGGPTAGLQIIPPAEHLGRYYFSPKTAESTSMA